MTQPKPIKVRIAVAVWPDGSYAARGWSNAKQDDLRSYFQEENSPGYQLRWIEAEVPAYDEPVVTGEVVG